MKFGFLFRKLIIEGNIYLEKSNQDRNKSKSRFEPDK